MVQGIENGSSSLLDDNGELHACYHTDYLGTTDYLTSAVNSKVISWTSYNEWVRSRTTPCSRAASGSWIW